MAKTNAENFYKIHFMKIKQSPHRRKKMNLLNIELYACSCNEFDPAKIDCYQLFGSRYLKEIFLSRIFP